MDFNKFIIISFYNLFLGMIDIMLIITLIITSDSNKFFAVLLLFIAYLISSRWSRSTFKRELDRYEYNEE